MGRGVIRRRPKPPAPPSFQMLLASPSTNLPRMIRYRACWIQRCAASPWSGVECSRTKAQTQRPPAPASASFIPDIKQPVPAVSHCVTPDSPIGKQIAFLSYHRHQFRRPLRSPSPEPPIQRSHCPPCARYDPHPHLQVKIPSFTQRPLGQSRDGTF